MAVTALVRLALLYLGGNLAIVMFVLLLQLHWLCGAWLLASLVAPLLYAVATSIWYVSRFNGQLLRFLLPYYLVLFVVGGINLAAWLNACAP